MSGDIYLKSTKIYGILYQREGSLHFFGYTDADYAITYKDSKITRELGSLVSILPKPYGSTSRGLLMNMRLRFLQTLKTYAVSSQRKRQPFTSMSVSLSDNSPHEKQISTTNR